MSSYSLSSETKKEVKSTVLALRGLLEGEFDPDTGEPIPPGGDVVRQIARYGILVDKPESLKSENAPKYLTDEEKNKRERICAAIKREVAIFGKLSDKAALRRGMRAFIRQTSYTWINRLLGLRCMEARELLKDDRGELDFVVTPSDNYGGLPRRAWRIKGEDPAKWQTAKLYDLQCEAIADACRQLTKEIKVLFDPEHDYGLIWPSAPALNTLLQKIEELDKVATASPFTSPDFPGWVYQYFQTIEKDQVFEAASKKKKKIEKDDIIPVTQIYTEHYMVEYLVQNSLGRLWMEMHPDTKLSAKWAYYVKPPEENLPVERELKKAIEIKLIDPALGSGHFHLVSFDLLLDMYEEEIENTGKPGWPETPSVEDKKDIPAAILEHNLFGIDIDARSIQLASLVLVMKARESGYKGTINHLNLVVANSAPFESEAWYQFIQNLEKEGKHSVARVLANLGIQLKNLDEFGSLLRIEDEMQKIIHQEKNKWIEQAKAGMEQEYLFPEMTKPKQQRIPFETAITDKTFFDRLGTVIQKELDAFYRNARREGLTEEAILASDAERGFDFMRLSIQRYDVVYTNPPYMGIKNMGERLKKFVASAYPPGKGDLYAAFILRCRDLAVNYGRVGMVTQKSWMFLLSFSNLRALPKEKLDKEKAIFQGLLREDTIETLIHLGPGAFGEISGEVVNIVLFTLNNMRPEPDHRIKAFRLIGYKTYSEKDSNLRKAVFEGSETAISYNPKQSEFLNVDGYPIAYWLSDNLLKMFQSKTKVKDYITITEGAGTRDEERFVKFFWEVIPRSDFVWVPYAKGGGYKKWSGLTSSIVDWTENGQKVKDFLISRFPYLKGNTKILIRDEHLFFRRGLTYTDFASGCLSCRIIKGFICSDQGPGVFSNDFSPELASSIFNSRLYSYLLRAISPNPAHLRKGYIYILPFFEKDILSKRQFEELTSFCIESKSWLQEQDLLERNFKNPSLDVVNGASLTDRYKAYSNLSELKHAMLHTVEGIIWLH